MKDENKRKSEKWRTLSLLAVAELFTMALWFSASAVVPQLTAEWGLSGGERSWLTMSVQLGFVVGAILSALFNLADRIPIPRLFGLSALLGALFNGMILLIETDPFPAFILRFLTGITLAGVYPAGMKLVATWSKEDRGLWIGLLVGALTVGSALPHLINALPFFEGSGGMPPWRTVLLLSSMLALVGAAIGYCFTREGPLLGKAQQFHWRHAQLALKQKPVRLANFGYLGHMWELYAMWAWVPICILASYKAAGWSQEMGRVAGFSVIAVGGIGSVLAGRLADRLGRTRVTIWSLIISGTCALIAGFFFSSPLFLTLICLVWGLSVVADSAQFSAAVSELSDDRYVGTALTVQTSLGFLLTLITLRVVPPLVESVGWQWTFPLLALGPIFGIISMARLRQLPEAQRMASGNL